MSATTQTRKADYYHATLAAPHATEPTQDAGICLYDIARGPKRVTRRPRFDATRDTRLFVPPLDTWTLDTVRMILWEVAGFIPDCETVSNEPDCFNRWIRDNGVTATVSQLQRGYVRLAVELPRVGASVTFDAGRRLLEPMRAALASMPTEPFPLAAIVDPGSQAEGDREESLDDVRLLQRIVATMKELSYFMPSVYRVMDRVLDSLREKHGLDDD